MKRDTGRHMSALFYDQIINLASPRKIAKRWHYSGINGASACPEGAMSQDVTAKMLKPDFDSEVSGPVHGYLFHEQRPRSPSPLARSAPLSGARR